MWDNEKSRKLRKERGVDFEDIVILVEGGFLLALIEHPNKGKYPNQKIYVINVNSYAYCVPCIENEESVRFITIFPSRGYTKIYLRGQ
ncbi:MAG: BrnT family toxin [Candidatus Omnitrophica bacterium]|nr:BrnT family toxin [Candidatus Omnitrophota bacterium]